MQKNSKKGGRVKRRGGSTIPFRGQQHGLDAVKKGGVVFPKRHQSSRRSFGKRKVG